MTYVRAQGTVIVSDCPGAAPNGMAAFGDVTALDPRQAYMELEAQVNRFLEPGVPAALRPTAAVVAPLPVKGTWEYPYPIYLLSLLTVRASSGIYNNLPAEQQKVLADLALVMDPAYVLAHANDILTLVKNYGDSKALPAAKPLPMSSRTVNKLIVVGIGLAIFLVAKGIK